MNVFDMHITLHKVLDHYPEMADDPISLSIARALIYTGGSLESVDFLTDSKKSDIVRVYQLLRDIDVFAKLPADIPEKVARQRQVKRLEMIDCLKMRLLAQHPSLEFMQLKYNVLTCRLGTRTIKIYVSTSRDYESSKDASEYNPHRVSSWHKGERAIFMNTSYDYFAFLTKIDANSLYKPSAHPEIEGMLVSFNQMKQWLARKDESKMVNYYIHYIQKQSTNKMNTTVFDTRETPHIDVTHWFNQPFALIHQ